jgi:hypothetical protein
MGDREGNVSYWVATTPETHFPSYPGGDLKVEVAVLGAGITGSPPRSCCSRPAPRWPWSRPAGSPAG